MRILRNSQIIILGVCIAVATVAASIIFSQGFLKIAKFTKEVITVTGSAQQEIKSDLAIWRGHFSRRQNNLPDAYKALKEDADKVKVYLLAKGVKENEILFSQIDTETIYKKNEKGNDTNDILGYRLGEYIEVKSPDVELISQLCRESTDLINSGIEFISEAPQYFYTKLDALKIEMLSKATANAKERAENMVNATGNKIGFMRSAKMGVFQITPVNSTEVSDWGVNDTTSLEKKVTAVVNASFAIE